MTRIAVGGFLHETNTFAPTKVTYEDFVHGGGWPAMAIGPDVLRAMHRINTGLSGFIEAAKDKQSGKRYVMLPEGTHTIIMEKNRMQLFRAVQQFLDESLETSE